jgi:hypothetical protein
MRRPSARFTLLAVAVVLLVATAAPACRQRQDASATRSGIVETRHHGPGPQLIPGWVWALSPGMTVAQVSEAVGVEPYKHESQADVGEPAGDLPRVEAFSWDTEAGVVEGVFRDERSTFVSPVRNGSLWSWTGRPRDHASGPSRRRCARSGPKGLMGAFEDAQQGEEQVLYGDGYFHHRPNWPSQGAPPGRSLFEYPRLGPLTTLSTPAGTFQCARTYMTLSYLTPSRVEDLWWAPNIPVPVQRWTRPASEEHALPEPPEDPTAIPVGTSLVRLVAIRRP